MNFLSPSILHRRFLGTVLLLLVLLQIPAPATASPSAVFGADDIRLLIPLLKQHDTIGVTQFTDTGAPKNITMAIRIAAARETVQGIFRDPANFYYVSTLFKENTVLDSHENSMVWSWASRHSFLSITGKNSLVMYPPRRTDVTIEESSIGSGTFTFQFFEDGPSHTIMLFSGFLDVDSSEWLIQFLVGNSPSMKQAMNIAIGLVVVKGIAELAQRMEKKRPNRPHRTRGEAGGVPEPLSSAELTLLKPLLTKGQLFLCDSTREGRLKQVSVVDLVNTDEASFRAHAANPHNYAKYIGAISDIQVKNQTPASTEFSWTIGLSIFGLTSVNELRSVDDGVTLEARSGDLEGAAWHWQTTALSPTKTIVAYHAFADVAKMSTILKSTVTREPYLEHGLVLGSNIVMMKAMKQIAQEKKEP